VGCIKVEDYHKFTANGIISGNSELPLSAYDSCRLLVLNTFNYVVNPFMPDAYFDYKQFYKDSQIAQRFMDDVIDLEIEAIDRIIKKIISDPEPMEIKENELSLWKKIRKTCQTGRRTGTGVTAIGDTLAGINIKYASKKSIDEVAKIYKTLKLGCYRSSVNMAKELGAFKCWNHELEKDNSFLQDNSFLLRIKGEDLKLYTDMKKYGRRNISLLTTAPCGTISLLAMSEYNEKKYCNKTAGIEPLFMMSFIRRKKVNPDDDNVRIDFIDNDGDSWQEFEIYHPTLQMWLDVTKKSDIMKSPWADCCAENIDWKQRVKLQAAAAKHVDHSISSTVNLPENATTKDVSGVYTTAWRTGCKGITIYRKGCRTGVLISKKEKISLPTERPKELDCDVWHVSVRKEPYFVLVSLYDNTPYEIFAGQNEQMKKSIKKGKLIKKYKSIYHAILEDGSELTPNDFCSEDEEGLTRLASLALRSGTNIHAIVKQLEKVQGNMQSFAKSMARALKKYIPDGTIEGEQCPKCESDLVRQEGCVMCNSCGFSKCM